MRDGTTSRWTIDPEALGFRGLKATDLAGGEPAENARVIERVLVGKGPAAAEAAVLLNAAAAIYVAGLAESLEAALVTARTALEQGKGWEALGRLRRASVSA